MTGSNPRVAPDLVREHAPKLADPAMSAVSVLATVAGQDA
jgi:hypothetical protein